MPSSRTATVAANLSGFASFLMPIPPTIPRTYSTLSGNGAANAHAKAAGRVRGPPAALSAPRRSVSLRSDLVGLAAVGVLSPTANHKPSRARSGRGGEAPRLGDLEDTMTSRRSSAPSLDC